MGDFFKQFGGGAQPTTGTQAPGQAGGATAPDQGGGFGQGLTNLLTNPLLGTALTGYFGAMGAPRLSGMGGAISRGGLMAMGNLPNLIKAQQEQQLLPMQLAQQKLALQQAQEKEQAIEGLPANMNDMQNMSPRSLARIDPGLISPMLQMGIGRQANAQGAAMLEAYAQDPKYAGTEMGGLMHQYAGMLSVAPQYVPFNDLMKLVMEGRKDEAEILLKGAEYQTELGKPKLQEAQTTAEGARTIEELASANRANVEARLAPDQLRARQDEVAISNRRADIEAAKIPIDLRKQIDTVANSYTKSNLIPGFLSEHLTSKGEKYKMGMYNDLINHGATPDYAASKVRMIDPYFTVPRGAEADEGEPGPVGGALAPPASYTPTPPSAPAPGTPAATGAATVGGKPAPAGPTVGGMTADEFLKKHLGEGGTS